jgi:threonine/homoserine/homoserine lactone efflux protein
MSVAFLLTTIVVVATPGTGAVYVIAAFGCTLGVLPHMIAAITGLAAIMNRSAAAFQTVKWLGVAYLLVLAWQAMRDGSALDVKDRVAAASPLRVITTAILINLLNPKLTIFFFAFLPQFIPVGQTNSTGHMVELSLVFMAFTFVVFAAYGAFAATMRAQVIGRPRVLAWLRRTFAATYVVMAGRLALQAR